MSNFRTIAPAFFPKKNSFRLRKSDFLRGGTSLETKTALNRAVFIKKDYFFFFTAFAFLATFFCFYNFLCNFCFLDNNFRFYNLLCYFFLYSHIFYFFIILQVNKNIRLNIFINSHNHYTIKINKKICG